MHVTLKVRAYLIIADESVLLSEAWHIDIKEFTCFGSGVFPPPYNPTRSPNDHFPSSCLEGKRTPSLRPQVRVPCFEECYGLHESTLNRGRNLISAPSEPVFGKKISNVNLACLRHRM